MKNFLLFLSAASSIFMHAQTSVTQPAGNAATSPSSACLSCPGSTWNNELNVTALDGNPADIGLMQKGFCFQSTCFASRYLMADQFGFAIPSTATVVGVEVNITRKATDTSAIKDSVVQLITSGAPAGVAKKSTAYWDTSYMTITYGGPADLWGSTSAFWTPAAINSSTTGVNLKIFNDLAVASQSVYVDFISMTVYFTNTTGIIESQVSTANSFFVSMTENTLQFSFLSDKASDINLFKLYDCEGKLVFEADAGKVSIGRQLYNAHVQNLNPGIYFAHYYNGVKQMGKKVLLINK